MSHRPADHSAPMASLPLFQQGVGVPPPQQPQTRREHDERWAQVQAEWHASPEGRPYLTPTQHGQAGAEDAEKHLREEAPGWLLDALGDSLLAFQGGDFTSEMVRHRAEQSEAVKGWLGVKGRENCFPGWFRSRIRLHKLVRVDRAPAIAKRATRRGATLPYWKFPA